MENDLLEPLPVENMPAWENIPQSYKDDVDEYFSDDDGNIYCVPEATVVAPALGYNTEYFDEPPSSWEILWNEDLEGQVTVWDRSYIAGSIAAKVAGQDWRDPDDFDELVAAHDVVLVDFYADWCGPCQMMEPAVKAVAADTDAAVVKVDVDTHQALAAEYGVQGIPTLLVFSGGELADRMVGAQSGDALTEAVTEHAA